MMKSNMHGFATFDGVVEIYSNCLTLASKMNQNIDFMNLNSNVDIYICPGQGPLYVGSMFLHFTAEGILIKMFCTSYIVSQ